MNSFWSGWIIFLIVLNMGITLFLFLWGQWVKIPVQPDGTSGHVWAHGVLREGVRKLPMWWVLTSAAMFAVGFAYLALYPGFGSYKGILGWTAHSELQRDLDANQAKLAPLMQHIGDSTVERLAGNPAATQLGQRLFIDNCSACHGRDGEGNTFMGAPNLVDADWLYGGDAKTILASVLDGRSGTMPPFGATLGETGVSQVANYVLSLSGAAHSPTKAAAGKASFAVCAACHGAEGKGNPALGAPNLTDGTWLYGNELATIEKTIRDGRNGVMPAWRGRLSEDEAKAISAWILAQAQPGAASH